LVNVYYNFFVKSKRIFHIQDKENNILQVNETKKNYIYINDLKSNNYYELKVFIKTHIGYNPEHFLFTNFTTKTRCELIIIINYLLFIYKPINICFYTNADLTPVDDLVVYKKSLKYRLVGLRWYYIEDASLDGFIISMHEDTSEETFGNENKVSVITPTKCPAWPKYYCYTYRDLSPTNNFTFNVRMSIYDIKCFMMQKNGYNILFVLLN